MTSYADRRRVWTAAAAAVAAFVLVLAWFFGVQPQLAEASALRSDTEALRQHNESLEARTAALRRQARHRDELEEEVEEALAALPPSAALPAFSRQVTLQAQQSRVVLESILVGDEAPVVLDAADPTASDLRSVPVTLVSRGAGVDQREFLRKLQLDGPRRALVTSTALVPRGSGSIVGASTMTTQLTLFSAPLPDATRSQLEELLRSDVP